MVFTKLYTFAKVSASCYLYETDFHQGNQVINVSVQEFIESLSFFRERNTIARHIPLNKNGDMGFGNLLSAVRCLLSWDKKGKRSIVLSEIGNYNNRVVIEAFHYAKMGFHYDDRCRGYQNHLIYHSMYGHLPPLPQIEYELKRLGEEFKPEVQQSLDSLKETASRTYYNALAEKADKFDKAIREVLKDEHYENLSPIMSCFNQVKVKDGYVLDGFQSGSRHSSRMVLHARKISGFEFIPLHNESFQNESVMWKVLEKENESILNQWIEDNKNVFDDSMYIRTRVHYSLTEHLVRPIWEDLIVPFNEEGIWEAILLYIAPKMMPGAWHAIMGHIYPVCNDADFIRRCKTLEDYRRYTGTNALYPKVSILSDNNARVYLAAWGWYGLKGWTFNVTRKGDSVEIKVESESPESLIYYKPTIIV